VHRVGNRGEVLARRAFRGHPGDADLEHTPRLEHLVGGEAVERGLEPQRLAAERRRSHGHEGAGAVPGLDHPERAERLERRSHARPADADPPRQLALSRQPLAGAKVSRLNQAADIRDHLFGGQQLRWFGLSRDHLSRCHTTQS
jgi:hypothetical protein